MKLYPTFTFLISLSASAVCQENPGWKIAPISNDPEKIAEWVASLTERSSIAAGSLDKGSFDESGEGLTVHKAAYSLSLAESPAALGGDGGMMMPLSGPLGNEADVITPEIEALAEGLRHDPLRIFEFVRNYIEYDRYYGSKKGAHLTLLEGSGNDMDQAALLVALLRASGHTASYRFGPCMFPLAVFPDWWGISSTPFSYMNDQQFADLADLSDTSPANIARWRLRLAVFMAAQSAGYYNAEPFTSGGLEWVSIPYCFVEFTHNSTTYKLSPAYKAHSKFPGIDLISATQYNRGNLLSSAGGSTGTPDWVSGLSESGIATRLNTYTNNLRTALREGITSGFKPYHELTVPEIIGGSRITKVGYDSFGAVLQMTPDSFATWGSLEGPFDAIPTAKMSKLELTAGTYNSGTQTFTSTLYTHEITMPSLQGKKLSLSFVGNTARIHLDEALRGSTFTVSGADFDLRLQAKHGHYMLSWSGSGWVSNPSSHDQTWVTKYKKRNDFVYAFPYSFGNPDKHLRNRQQQLDTYRRAGTTDWRATTEGMNILGLTYLKGTSKN